MLKKVSIINFKGGVGKTTLAFHLASYLSRDAKVLLVDIDHQSSLSVIVLGALWPKQISRNLTVNSIFESFTNRKVPMPGEEIIVRNPFLARDGWHDLYPNLDFRLRTV